MSKSAVDTRSVPTGTPSYRLQVLGGLRLMAADGRAIELPTRKSALLLAYLAVPSDTMHARDRLAGLLWPSSGQEQARGSLRHAVAALRKLLGSDAIDGPRDQLGLRPGVVTVDLDAVTGIAKGVTAPDPASPALTGAFLDGVSIEGEALAEWHVFERTRSRGVQQAALERTVDALLAAGRIAVAVQAAERLVALDPLREHSHRVLMHTFVRAGERSKALAQFRSLQVHLKSELDITPSSQSVALAEEIRRASALDADGGSAPLEQDTAPSHTTGAAEPQRIAIAVLPFQSVGDNERIVNFADGFASDLVTGLSRMPEVSVIAWPSSAQVSGRANDAVQSAIELDASYALTGSLRLVENRLRIGAQLLAARSRAWIWAERFDLDAGDTFSAQDEIVLGIMGAVDASIRRSEREAARARPIADLDAWSLFHLGMWHAYRFTADDVTAAEQCFTEAVRRSPLSAAPYAGLAYASLVRIQWLFTGDTRTTLSAGLGHASAALVRDEYDAHVHTVLGRLLVLSGQIQRGIEHLERAIDLNPSQAQAYYGLGHALYASEKPADALGPLAAALRLSPKDPLASMFHTMSAFCHLMLDDLPAAEAAARRARNLLSKEFWSRLALAATLQISGDLDGARSAVSEAREIVPGLSLSIFEPLVQHIPPKMRDRVLAALSGAGLLKD